MTSTAPSPIPADLADLLESTALAHVATIGPDGAPQVNPVWFDWDGRYLRFSQTTQRQKVRNLRRDPRIALSIVDPNNPQRYLELRGVVASIEPDPDLAFVDKVTRKYMGRERDPSWNPPGEERVVVVVEPRHTTPNGVNRHQPGSQVESTKYQAANGKGQVAGAAWPSLAPCPLPLSTLNLQLATCCLVSPPLAPCRPAVASPQCMIRPAEMLIAWPVMPRADSEAR